MSLPGIERLAGGRLLAGCRATEQGVVVREIDATLGVPGLPQSATGQTALFTGVNAARHMGRHVAAYPGPQLKRIISEEGLLAKAVQGGAAVTFANAFGPRYLAQLDEGRGRISVTVHATLSAGLALRSADDLRAGRAVSWDFERDLFARGLDRPVPTATAEQAGRDLAVLARDHDLTLYESFLTDLAGHGRFGLTAELALARVDGFFSGLLEAAAPELSVLVCSDHGNVEEADHSRHTRNRVPLIVRGPRAGFFHAVEALHDVAGCVLAALQSSDEPRFDAVSSGGRR
jgi:hypothetical protein